METQFSLKRLLLIVAACAVAAAHFYWFQTDMAVAILLAMAALWPIVRYGDRALLLKSLACTVLALATLVLGCQMVWQMTEP